MVLLRSMLLHPSVLAPMLLQLLVVCLISFPKPGHSAKCKLRQESEGNKIITDGVEDCGNELYWRCYASFCTAAGDLMWNEWGCIQSGKNPDEDKANCVSAVSVPEDIDDTRGKYGLPTAGHWTCTCQLGAVYVEMDNVNLVNPNPALRPTTTTTTQATPKMKCKLHIETEDGEFDKKLNTKDEAECKKTMKCGAIFCKTNDGELVWNQWSCFPADSKRKACANETPNAVNKARAEWKLVGGTDWKCRCRFGANGTDMSNAKFVPSSAPVPTIICHGIGAMALMMAGLIIAFLPAVIVPCRL